MLVAVEMRADLGIVGGGQLGRMLRLLRAQHCHELVISGAMTRPDLKRLRTDWGFYRNLPRILKLMRGGDDSVLRRVIRFFEDEGFGVCGIPDVAPSLLAPEGLLTGRTGEIQGANQPSSAVMRDVDYAAHVVATIGHLDIGQAVVESRPMRAGEEQDGARLARLKLPFKVPLR